jgi:glycosyltransferase involved in cell wall biosynthesis
MCCNERAFRLVTPARKWAGKPPVIYRNGLTATFKNRSINRVLFRDAARMIVISDPLREEMASYGWIPNERLQVIRNGIDTAGYQTDPAARQRVRAEVGTAPDAVVAAVLARVTEDKGQVETIEALASLASDYPKAELWIVGEGSLRPRLEDQARELGVTDRVKFLGFRTDIAAVFQAVDIVVQASHREGLGNTLLEAMASRKPILASSVGGIVDVVVPGETGELVPPYDSAAIARALGPLLADPELRERYGEAGWRRVQEQFRLERETADWCRLFEELGGAAGARSSRDNRHDLAAV